MRAAMGMKRYVKEAELEAELAELPDPNDSPISFEQFLKPELQRAISVDLKFKWSYGRAKSNGRSQSRGMSRGSPGGGNSKGSPARSPVGFSCLERPPVKLSRPMQMTAQGRKLRKKLAGLTEEEQYMLAIRNCREIAVALDEIPEKAPKWSPGTRITKKNKAHYDRWIPEVSEKGTSYMSPTMSPRPLDSQETSFGSPKLCASPSVSVMEERFADIALYSGDDYSGHDVSQEEEGSDGDCISIGSLNEDIPPLGAALGVPIGQGVKITSKPLLKMKAEAAMSISSRASTPPSRVSPVPLSPPRRAGPSRSMTLKKGFIPPPVEMGDLRHATTIGTIRDSHDQDEEESMPGLMKQMSLSVMTLGFFGRPPQTADGILKRRRASVGALSIETASTPADSDDTWDVVKHKLLYSPTRSSDGSDPGDNGLLSERRRGSLRRGLSDRLGSIAPRSTDASPRTPKSSFVPISLRQWSQGSDASEGSDGRKSARRSTKSRSGVKDLSSPEVAESRSRHLLRHLDSREIELPATPSTSVSSMKRRKSQGKSETPLSSPVPMRADLPPVSGRRNESEMLSIPIKRRSSLSETGRKERRGSLHEVPPFPSKARRLSRAGSLGGAEEESGNWGPVLADSNPLEIERKWKASGISFKSLEQLTDLLQTCIRLSLEKSFVALLGFAFDDFNSSELRDDDFKAMIEIFLGKAEEDTPVMDMLKKSYKVSEDSILAKTSRAGGGFAIVVSKILGEILDKNDLSIIKEKMNVFEEEYKSKMNRKARENDLAMKNPRIKQIMAGRHRLVVKELSQEERPDFGFRDVKEMQLLLRYCVRNKKDEAFGDLFRAAASLVEARYIYGYMVGKSENQKDVEGCFAEMVGVKDLDPRNWALTIFTIWWAAKNAKTFQGHLYGNEFADREGLCALGQIFTVGEIAPVSAVIWLMEQDIMERRPETSGSMNRLLTHVPVVEMEVDTENFMCQCVDRTRFNRRPAEDVEGAVRACLLRSDRRGRTMLHFAVEYGSIRLFELMFHLYRRHNIEVNLKDNNHTTPIHLAMERDNVKYVKDLITYGANPNITDKGGNTPMHYGAAAGRTNQCMWLANEGGGDPSVNNLSGMSPHNSAMDTNMEETATALIGLNAKRALMVKESKKAQLQERRKSNISLLPSPKQPSGQTSREFPETVENDIVGNFIAGIRSERDASGSKRRKSVQFS